MEEFEYLKKIDLKRKIKTILRKYKNKKVIVYGAGKLSEYIFRNYDLSKLNIIAVADKKFETQTNRKFFNIQGITPDEIAAFDADGILIFNLKGEAIIKYLYEKISCKQETAIEWILKPDLIDFLRNKLKYGKPKQKAGKYIFTFWEPKSKMPAYVNLCMQTWKKFLPEYEIVVLDYENLDEWLGYKFYDEYLYKNFSLPKQADALRAAVLYLHGGIWFDADTIITSDKIKNVINQNTSVTMFNTHLGFICAKRGAKVMKMWTKTIKRKILIHKLYETFVFPMKYLLEDTFFAKKDNWDYLGNSIVDKIRKKTSQKEFLSLERTQYFALPENNYYDDMKISAIEKYTKFYFEQDFSEYISENEKGIICLHNSWTPNLYSKMSGEDFLKQDFTLAKILNKYTQKEA